MDLGLRLTVAASLSLAPVLPLGLRLAQLQVLRHDALAVRAEGEFVRIAQEAAPRADLLDRNGRVLARSLPAWSCFADKAMIKDPAAFGRRLAPLLGLPPDEIARLVREAGRFAWLKTKMTADQADRLRQSRVEGLGLVPAQERVYPNGNLGRDVLGLVGASGHGLAGVELSLDQLLRGLPRRFEIIRDGTGRPIYQDVADGGTTPKPIRLTIDRNIQFLAEDALRQAMAAHSFKEGVVGVEDPRNGEILAMAAWPQNPLKNPLIQDAYEPGSVFKVVTALAALKDDLVRPDQTFDGEQGRWEVAPRVWITDHEPSGPITLAQILQRSSNIGISKVVQLVGAARFYRMSREMGFGAKTGISLPGETSGSVRPVDELTRVNLAASSYGYGVAVSPLQVLDAYSAVANGGTLWEPKLVLDGKPPVEVRRVAPEEAVSKLSAMLENVVERGTGETARVPGYRIAGKTGTAREINPETHKYSTTAYTASFIGFFPVSDPRWTVLVVLHQPTGSYYGAQAAAPIFARLARRLLALQAVAPDSTPSAVAASGRN